jgi:hypothetical protein
MQPEDCCLADIDNVFLLRHAKRLPFEKRNDISEVERQHKENPIDAEVVWRFFKRYKPLLILPGMTQTRPYGAGHLFEHIVPARLWEWRIFI